MVKSNGNAHHVRNATNGQHRQAASDLHLWNDYRLYYSNHRCSKDSLQKGRTRWLSSRSQLQGAGMRANEILLSATDTIRERGLSYGHPSDNLQHTAMLLSAYLQTPIHDYQVAGIMVLVKLARTNQSAQHIDNWVDLCSYGALAGQLATEENELYV